ncbi:MAG: hypothetical protein ACOYM3_31770 [Terrimicrobiaceae bacterium]
MTGTGGAVHFVMRNVTVYQFEHRPYGLPITRALEALGVAFATQNVSNADRSEIIRRTAGKCYQMPVLGHDGAIIFESSPTSTDVARDVNAVFSNGRLFPAGPEGRQRIVIAQIENEVEGVGGATRGVIRSRGNTARAL